MIIVQTRLSYESPHELRRQLQSAGFSVYLIDQLTGSIISNLSSLYNSHDDEKIIMLRSGLEYLCIYNGDKLPPNNILSEIYNNKHVNRYVIQKM